MKESNVSIHCNTYTAKVLAKYCYCILFWTKNRKKYPSLKFNR
jgi:hypothetical protein